MKLWILRPKESEGKWEMFSPNAPPPGRVIVRVIKEKILQDFPNDAKKCSTLEVETNDRRP